MKAEATTVVSHKFFQQITALEESMKDLKKHIKKLKNNIVSEHHNWKKQHEMLEHRISGI